MSENFGHEEASMDDLWALTTEENDYETRTNALVKLSVRLKIKGEHWKSIATAQTAMEMFKNQGDQYQVGCSFMQIGDCHSNLENHHDAIEHYSLAADLFQSIANDSARGEALFKLGSAHINNGNQGEAVLTWRNAVEIQKAAQEHSSAGKTSLELGSLLGSQNRQTEALEVFRQSLAHYQDAEDVYGTIKAHDRIAAALIDLGQMTEAVERLEEALALSKYLDVPARVSYQKYRLGWTFVILGRCEDAIPLLEEASAAQKEIGNFEGSAEADLQRAHALRGLGLLDEGMEVYKTVRAVFESLKKRELAATVDLSIGKAFQAEDKLLEAERPLLSALSIANEINDAWLQRMARTALAELYIERMEPAEGLAMLNKFDAADWGDDLTRKAAYLSCKAKCNIQLTFTAEGRELARKVIDLHAITSVPLEAAEAYEMLAMTGEGENPAELDRLTAMAIANYLAAGEVDEATRLSKRMLPKRGEAPYLSRSIDREQPALFDESSQNPGAAGRA